MSMFDDIFWGYNSQGLDVRQQQEWQHFSPTPLYRDSREPGLSWWFLGLMGEQLAFRLGRQPPSLVQSPPEGEVCH